MCSDLGSIGVVVRVYLGSLALSGELLPVRSIALVTVSPQSIGLDDGRGSSVDGPAGGIGGRDINQVLAREGLFVTCRSLARLVQVRVSRWKREGAIEGRAMIGTGLCTNCSTYGCSRGVGDVDLGRGGGGITPC